MEKKKRKENNNNNKIKWLSCIQLIHVLVWLYIKRKKQVNDVGWCEFE